MDIIEETHRLLMQQLGGTFMGTPKAEDLRQLLRFAHNRAAVLNDCIKQAEQALAGAGYDKPK